MENTPALPVIIDSTGLDITEMLTYAIGTVFQSEDGTMYRVAKTGGSGWKRQIIRMTKRTANGLALKAGEKGSR